MSLIDKINTYLGLAVEIANAAAACPDTRRDPRVDAFLQLQQELTDIYHWDKQVEEA